MIKILLAEIFIIIVAAILSVVCCVGMCVFIEYLDPSINMINISQPTNN